jgi:hypothetical protein
MTPKETYSLVIERAKHGTLIDRCGRIVYYIVMWVAGVCAALPIQSAFFPPEYLVVAALGIPCGLLLLGLAIFEWLKWRLL